MSEALLIKALEAGATPTELRILVALMRTPRGLTSIEIANAVDSTPNSVKVLMHRLRRKGVPIESPRDEPGVPRRGEDRESIERYRIAAPARAPDFETAWRYMHEALSWIQLNKGLTGYLGWNFADIANALIRRAYPDLGVPPVHIATRKPAVGLADQLAEVLEEVLNTSGARGTYHAGRHFDAVQSAEALLIKFKGAQA